MFQSEEHGQFKILKKQARRERKLRRFDQEKKGNKGDDIDDEPSETIYDQLAAIMNKQNDGSVAKELGRKPFGIDKEEAIKIMS